MILLIDNYDSFSYNLYQLIGTFRPDLKIIRNDAETVSGIRELHPEAIVLSPGPGKPSDAGICTEIVKELGDEIPILGVCLGHQAICEVFGGVVTYAGEMMHGKASSIKVDIKSRLFRGFNTEIPVARYHSLSVVPDTMPDELLVTAHTETGEVMAVEHKRFPIYGVQFHPESILTPDGAAIIRNFLEDE